MVQWHTKGKKKPSGGHRNSIRRVNKRLAWKGGTITNTRIGKEKRSLVKGRGKTQKTKLFQANTASVIHPKTRKPVKAEIVGVEENKANRLFTRRNIITKGAKIRVRIGEQEASAIVTSRPGQSGAVQAILQ